MNARIVLAIAAILLWAAPPRAPAQAIQWSSVASGAGNPESYLAASRIDASGNVVMTGLMQVGSGSMRTVKYAAGTGQVLWQVVTPNAGPGGMALDAAGNVLIAGSIAVPGANNAGVVFKLNGSTGALVWQATVGDSGFGAIALDAAGNPVATGFVNPGQMRTIKLSGASGGLLWDTVLPAYVRGTHVAVDAAGDVVVAGAHVASSNVNYATVKLRGNDGGVTWQRTFNGAANFDDFVAGLALDGSGNAIVTGRSVNASGRLAMATLKYAAADGATMWQAVLDGGATDFYFSRDLALDASGNVYLAGVGSSSGDNAFHFMAVKLAAASGAEVWRRFGAGANDATAVAVDAAGNAVVGGFTSTLNYRAIRYAPDGTLLWQATFNAGAISINPVLLAALDPQGHPVLAGPVFTGSANDFAPVKFDVANGALLWRGGSRPLPQPASMRLATNGRSTLVRDPAGNAIVAGTASNGTNNDIKVVKYAATTGLVMWERTINNSANGEDLGLALATDSVGNVILAGSMAYSTYSTVYVERMRSSDGSTIWTDGYYVPGQGNRIQAVALDAAGNVFTAGAGLLPNATGTFYEVVKRDGSTGSPVWTQKIEPRVTGQSEEAIAIAIDGAGNAIVTGVVFNTVDSSAKTIKFDGTNGAILWAAAAYNDAVNGSDRPTGLALDSAGNAFVTGFWRNGATVDMFTIKYAAANGAVLWNRSVDAGGSDAGFGIAVDAAGDAIVTGASQNGTHFDMRTIKYAGFDGRVRWDRTMAGPGNGHDLGYAVSLTAAGDVVVAGATWNGTSNDFKVVKHAGASGAVLWEKAYNATWNGDDSALAVATVAGAVYVAGNCYETEVPAICTLRIEDTGITAGADSKADFNADRITDLLALQADGRVAAWLMRAGNIEFEATLIPAATGWAPKLVADFNGDGFSDIVWQHADGRVAMWLMNGTTVTAAPNLLPAGTGWTPVLAGDFNGDGRADIVWQRQDGRVAVWLMNGGTSIAAADLIGPKTGYAPILVGDFDGDGRSDIVWQHRDGRIAMWLMDGTRLAKAATLIPTPGTGWLPRLIGDFNGDGYADLVWQNVDGRTALWLMMGTSLVSASTVLPAGTGYHVTRVADVNGDGRSDLVWQREDGRIDVWMMNGVSIAGAGTLAQPGAGWSVRRATDFNRDGRDDLVVQNAAGAMQVWLMNGTAFTPSDIQKGLSGWTLVP